MAVSLLEAPPKTQLALGVAIFGVYDRIVNSAIDQTRTRWRLKDKLITRLDGLFKRPESAAAGFATLQEEMSLYLEVATGRERPRLYNALQEILEVQQYHDIQSIPQERRNLAECRAVLSMLK